MLTKTERDTIFRIAREQLREEQTPTRAEQAAHLIREALDAFVNPEARIDLREWVQSARAYLEECEPRRRTL